MGLPFFYCGRDYWYLYIPMNQRSKVYVIPTRCEEGWVMVFP